MGNLFSEISIKDVVLKNRIVLPPMNLGWADNNGIIREDLIEKYLVHYEKIARGGCGLIILESHSVMKSGRDAITQTGIWSGKHLKDLRKAADICHRYGAKILVQIEHAGFKTSPQVCRNTFSPSIFSYDGVRSKAMTEKKITEIQESFVIAAQRAKEAELDGIELHGAHGYLLGQFISPLTNYRRDIYGGSLNGRVRFASDIIKRIKKEVSDRDFLVGYRLGGNDPTLEDGIKVAKKLEKAGADLLHVSYGTVTNNISKLPAGFDFSWVVYCGIEIKKHLNIPVIVVTGIRTPQQAGHLIENNMADLVAVGKGQLVDSNWANKAEKNLDVIKCIDCKVCFWYTDSSKCPALID
jgi:2,4-dienoyl-CoA reductase-like NADH-dependent reductase (Old Yellow Enzyme family)